MRCASSRVQVSRIVGEFFINAEWCVIASFIACPGKIWSTEYHRARFKRLPGHFIEIIRFRWALIAEKSTSGNPRGLHRRVSPRSDPCALASSVSVRSAARRGFDERRLSGQSARNLSRWPLYFESNTKGMS